MERELPGKCALVTGASRGIGLAIARRLATDGTQVAMNSGHSRELLEALAASVLGGLDILVNNAAITKDSLVMLMRPDAWSDVLQVDVDDAFHRARAALQPMIARRAGLIVKVVSPAASFGKSGAANHAAARGALVAFTKSRAADVADAAAFLVADRARSITGTTLMVDGGPSMH